MSEAPLAIITHGWASSPNWFWIRDTKQQLEKAGYRTLTPHMPRTRHPNLEEWEAKLADVAVGSPDVTIIADSCSGRSGLSYTQKHPVRNLIVIASLVGDLGQDDFIESLWRDFYSKHLDKEAIKRNCSNIIGLYSEDDDVIPYNQADLFELTLGKVLRFSDQGHFRNKSLPVDLTQYLI